MHDDCSLLSCVHVSLGRQEIPLGQLRVCPKTAVQQIPPVLSVLPVQIEEMVIVLVARKDAIVGSSSDFSAVLRCAESLRLRSSTARHQNARGLLGFFGDDVDDAIYRIGAPYRPAGPADHFNSFDVLEWHVLRIPIDAPEKRRVHGPAINKHQ